MGNNQINYSFIHSNEDAKEETPVYRSSALEKDEDLIDACPGGEQDLKSLLKKAFEEYGENECLGSRKKKSDDGDDMGDYEFKTYNEVAKLTQSIAKAIISKELCPKVKHDDVNSEDSIEFRALGIYAKN